MLAVVHIIHMCSAIAKGNKTKKNPFVVWPTVAGCSAKSSVIINIAVDFAMLKIKSVDPQIASKRVRCASFFHFYFSSVTPFFKLCVSMIIIIPCDVRSFAHYYYKYHEDLWIGKV